MRVLGPTNHITQATEVSLENVRGHIRTNADAPATVTAQPLLSHFRALVKWLLANRVARSALITLCYDILYNILYG